MSSTKAPKEYFKCKRCYTKVNFKKIARHHTKSHANMSHEKYLDKCFDLSRPLYKCDCCSTRMKVNHLVKHRLRAHPNEDNTFKKYTLPLIQNLEAQRKTFTQPKPKVLDCIQLSSEDSSDFSSYGNSDTAEDGEIRDENFDICLGTDKAIQCDESESEQNRSAKKRQMVDKCVGKHHETNNKSTNTHIPMESKSVQCENPIKEPFQLTVEYDDDGFAELVFF